MGVFESLLGFLAGGTAAAAGAGINRRNQKQRWNAYQAQERAKLDSQLAYAQSLRNAEDAETRAARAELERLIGTTIEEDQRRRRYYNLPLEYELALRNLDAMFDSYKKSHPPGSTARLMERKFVSYYSTEAQQVLCDYRAEYRDWPLPYPEAAYEMEVERAFWKQAMTSYKGPLTVNGRRYAVTYFVGPGLYALGQARKELIRQGYLPSNCRSRLWVNWSPYVIWLGEEWNDEFHTAVDLGSYFDNTWMTPKPRSGAHLIYEEQAAYEKQHPEQFQTE